MPIKKIYERDREYYIQKAREHYWANRDRILSYQKNHARKHSAEQKKRTALRRAGISMETYKAMLAAQNGACKVCFSEDPGGPHKAFHIDHCHTTEVIRGLLCFHCNVLIGQANDSPELLRALADYLEQEHKDVPRIHKRPRRKNLPRPFGHAQL